MKLNQTSLFQLKNQNKDIRLFTPAIFSDWYWSFLQWRNSVKGAEPQSHISDSTLDVRSRWIL